MGSLTLANPDPEKRLAAAGDVFKNPRREGAPRDQGATRQGKRSARRRGAEARRRRYRRGQRSGDLRRPARGDRDAEEPRRPGRAEPHRRARSEDHGPGGQGRRGLGALHHPYEAHVLGRGAGSLVRPLRFVRSAARGDRPRHHLRRHGRDQHGPRRDGDARRLRHLCGADGAAAIAAELVARLRHSARLRRRRDRRRPDRAAGDPLSLYASARDAACDLGRLAHPAADGAQPVRGEQPPREQPAVHVRRLSRRRPRDHDQPDVDHRSGDRGVRRVATRSARHQLRPANARRDPEPPHGGGDGHIDSAGRHARLRVSAQASPESPASRFPRSTTSRRTSARATSSTASWSWCSAASATFGEPRSAR